MPEADDHPSMAPEIEECYRAIVEQTNEILFLVNLDTKYLIYANTAFHKILGYTVEEVANLKLRDIVVHDKESIEPNIQHAQKEKYYSIGERMCRHKDGSLISLEVNANLIAYSGKEALCIIAREIAEHKHIDRRLTISQLISSHARDIILLVNRDGCIIEANEAAIKEYGYACDELLSKNIRDLRDFETLKKYRNRCNKPTLRESFSKPSIGVKMAASSQ